MLWLELDSFVQKFKNLCQVGGNPNLSMKSEAGKVSVSLQMELDIPAFQHQGQYRSRRNGPAQQRRRERRARERKAAIEETAAGIAPEEAVVLLLAEIAAKASIDECEIGNTKPEKDLDKHAESSAVSEVGSLAEGTLKASTEFKCQECESEFDNSKELRIHETRSHKVTNSPIPQIDGTSDASTSLVTKENPELDIHSKSKNQYPRNCERCSKFLRNHNEFRKHVVSCIMARK
jgi:hypothetical protein